MRGQNLVAEIGDKLRTGISSSSKTGGGKLLRGLSLSGNSRYEETGPCATGFGTLDLRTLWYANFTCGSTVFS